MTDLELVKAIMKLGTAPHIQNSLKNAMQMPKRYYGLHFYPGVAEYREGDKEPYRVFINEATAKKMDPTFTGKPVYVRHVDEVDLRNLQNEADGFVVRSFFNKADGKHWVEFIVVSDKGHAAIAKGWKLSNCYTPKGGLASGGQHNGVDFKNEIMDGEYEHLAIVDNPRYEESVILSPEDFKKYNEQKEAELQKLANSKDAQKAGKKGEGKMGFSIFKRAKVENEADLKEMVVTLPKSKVDMSLEQIVNELDEVKVQNMAGYANDEHMVKTGDDEEMSVKDLRKNYNKMKEEAAEREAMENDDDEEKEPELKNKGKKKKNDDDEEKEPELKNKKKKNESDDEESEDEDQVQNSDDDSDDEEEEQTSKKNAKEEKRKRDERRKKLENAEDDARDEDDEEVIETVHNELERGRRLMGSDPVKK